MSEAVQSPDPGLPLDATVAPRPLRGVIIPLAGLMAVLLLILVNAVLIRRHIASLPLNLVPATNAMAEHIEDLCRRSHLPPECLKRYEPIARHDAGAEWNEHAFEAGVPTTITAENFIAALTYGMALQQVSLERTDAPQGRWTELCFSMFDRPFAVVRVMGGAERHEYTAACDKLAQTFLAALAHIPDFTDLQEVARHDRQEGPVRWRTYTFRALARQEVEPAAARELLATTLPELQGEVPVAVAVPGQNAIEVSWKGLPIVRLDIEHDEPLLDEAENEQPMDSPEPQAAETAPAAGLSRPAPGAIKEASAKRPAPTKPADFSSATPRAAIIVDDGGYGTLASDTILALDTRLTLAILPDTPFARETAETARSRGFEVLVHLPLESENAEGAFPRQLTTSMSEDEMLERLDAALARVPGSTGVNNHTGSKFTADAAAMRRLLHGIKRRDLFFIDSRTTPDTVAETCARELGIPTASRSIFLDNDPEPEAIRAQATALVEMAESGVPAIGICHFRASTARLLPEILRLLEARGVALVHASELVQ